MLKLKSTGQEIYLVPWMGGEGEEPWPKRMTRVMIPNPNGEGHIQYVRKHKITIEKAK